MKSNKKIVLAYSGGLDTSIILKWLQENYDADVICYTADVGQEIDRKKIITNAKKFGVKNIIIKDLKDIFVKDYVYPMIRGHAIYEGVYLLGTSIARPLIAKDQIRVAKKFKAYAVSHGATGKGNDQVRFALGYHYFGLKIKSHPLLMITSRVKMRNGQEIKTSFIDHFSQTVSFDLNKISFNNLWNNLQLSYFIVTFKIVSISNLVLNKICLII